jgi:hypothetical protein
VKDYLLVNSNQYFVGEENIEVTEEVLEQLIRRTLVHYGQWRPLYINETIEVTDYNTYIKESLDGHRILGIRSMYYYQPILSDEQGKVDWEWDYNKDNGLLRSAVKGKYYVELLVEPKLEDIDFTNVEFLELLLAQYLMYVGASRKAFSFGDQPFENDGADIYSDGKELWEQTLESLRTEQDNWYMAIV